MHDAVVDDGVSRVDFLDHILLRKSLLVGANLLRVRQSLTIINSPQNYLNLSSEEKRSSR